IAKDFIKQISTRYAFSIPLPPHYMIVNPTKKPDLPQNLRQIKDFNLTTPITSARQLVYIAKLLQPYYFFNRILDSWIEIQKNKDHTATRTPESKEKTKITIPKTLEATQKYLESIDSTQDQ
ncbi:1508_t:CDS:1, partial [Racocetra fulgida]